MNALQQVVRTIYQQRELYMLDNVVNPADFVVRVLVNHLTRDILRSCDDQYFLFWCCARWAKKKPSWAGHSKQIVIFQMIHIIWIFWFAIK